MSTALSATADRTVSKARKAAVVETPAVLADTYGMLKAKIAEAEDAMAPLVAQMEECKKRLIASGLPEVDGSVYRVTVSVADRVTLDSRSIKADMPASWVEKYSQTAKVTTVRVGARLTRA